MYIYLYIETILVYDVRFGMLWAFRIYYGFVRLKPCTVLYAFVRLGAFLKSLRCTVLYGFVRLGPLYTSLGCTVLYAFVRVVVSGMYGFVR